MRTIWLVVEEVESGLNAGGETYCPLKAFQSEADAEAYADSLRLGACDHNDGKAHEFEDDDGEDSSWCACCEVGYAVEAVEFVSVLGPTS